MSSDRIRCGDHVAHDPTGETWVVAFADYETGYLSWCGWPEGRARIEDCTLVKRATGEEARKLAGDIVASRPHDMRARGVKRLYPELLGEVASAEIADG